MSDHDLLPLYALDSLSDDERVAFDAHLDTCSTCQRELASYGPVLDELASDVAVAPPPQLRTRVLAEIRDVAQERIDPEALDGDVAVADDLARRRGRTARRPSRAGRWLALAAAILALALIASTTTGVALWRRADRLDDQVAQLEQRAGQADELAAVLAADDAELVDVDTDLSGNLRVVVADSIDAGVVVADDLEAPPDDRVYQLWLVENEQPRSVGLIDRTSGVLGVLSDIGGAQAIAMSVEPPSGSEEPTGPIVMQAALN